MTEHEQGLVEPEGVNGGSDEAETGARPPRPHGDPRTGGDPDAEGSTQTDDTEVEESLGPPDQHDATPGQELSAGEG